jgi:hypothetical protein
VVPEYLSVTRKNKSSIDAYASTYSIGIPEDTFSVTVLSMTVDAIKAVTESSD